MAPERQVALVLPGGDVVVAGAALAELLSVLRAHADRCRGVVVPPAAAQPRWTATLHSLTLVVTDAAIEHQRQPFRGTAAVVPQSTVGAELVTPDGHPVLSDGEVGVAEAAESLGVSHRRIRAMAAAGGLVARKCRCRLTGQSSVRDQWVVSAASVHARLVNRRVA